MNNLVAKRPASVMRTATQPVRDHTSAMQRLQDQYFATLSRAQAQYFEGVRRITDALTKGDPADENTGLAPAETPAAQETTPAS